MPDRGLTHVALPVTDLEESLAFYATYAGMAVVHRRARQGDAKRGIAWISDRTRPFVIVLAEVERVERPLGPFAHLGVACASREEVDRLAGMARAEGRLRDGPSEMGEPVGYIANLVDPDGHTLELSWGQDVGTAVTRPSASPR